MGLVEGLRARVLPAGKFPPLTTLEKKTLTPVLQERSTSRPFSYRSRGRPALLSLEDKVLLREVSLLVMCIGHRIA